MNSDVPLSVALGGGGIEGYWLAHCSLEQAGVLTPEGSDPGEPSARAEQSSDSSTRVAGAVGCMSMTKGDGSHTAARTP